MSNLIEVKNITNSFGAQIVHEKLDLTLKEGEILGLVGGSGSGKSVLLRTILGLRKPQKGQVLVHGRNVHDLSREEGKNLQKNWGVLFQDGALFSGLNVLDNIGVPLREHTDLDQKTIEDMALLKLRIVGLEPEAAEKMPSFLSGGMARRAALARALALDPGLLFLDEPTGGLDPIAAAAFDDLVLSLHEAMNLSILIITHDLDTLVTVCGRVAMLVDKKITTGTLEDMMESDNKEIREYFNGPRMRAVMRRGA